MAAFLEGSRRPGDSSSEAPEVNGISVLEEADMLVREGVRWRDRGGDRRRRSRRRGGVQGTAGISLTGEAGLEMSTNLGAQIDALTWVDGDDEGSEDGGCSAACATVLR
jgi:hypothetical protein